MIKDDSVVELKRILKKDLGMKVTTAKARRIGEWLVRFYSHLSDEQKGISVGPQARKHSTDTNSNNSTK